MLEDCSHRMDRPTASASWELALEWRDQQEIFELVQKDDESSSIATQKSDLLYPRTTVLLPGRSAFDLFIDESEPPVIWLGVTALAAPEMIDAGLVEKTDFLLPVRDIP